MFSATGPGARAGLARKGDGLSQWSGRSQEPFGRYPAHFSLLSQVTVVHIDSHSDMAPLDAETWTDLLDEMGECTLSWPAITRRPSRGV